MHLIVFIDNKLVSVESDYSNEEIENLLSDSLTLDIFGISVPSNIKKYGFSFLYDNIYNNNVYLIIDLNNQYAIDTAALSVPDDAFHYIVRQEKLKQLI